MQPADRSSGSASPAGSDPGADKAVRLQLYVARSTPNSVRAESNLLAVLDQLKNEYNRPLLEIVDVFTDPKRAIKEGVIVTPTLIGSSSGKRVTLIGDLADRNVVESTIRDLLRCHMSE